MSEPPSLVGADHSTSNQPARAVTLSITGAPGVVACAPTSSGVSKQSSAKNAAASNRTNESLAPVMASAYSAGAAPPA